MGNRLFVIDIKSSNLKYLIRQLVACSQGSGGKVAHVLEDRGEDADGLLRELLLVPGQQGPQQRQAEGLPRVPPQLLAGGRPRGCRGQELGPLPSRLANCLVCVPDEMINWHISQTQRSNGSRSPEVCGGEGLEGVHVVPRPAPLGHGVVAPRHGLRLREGSLGIGPSVRWISRVNVLMSHQYVRRWLGQRRNNVQ